MTKLAVPFAMAQIVLLIIFTIASPAQPADSQSRATQKAAAETIKIKLVNGRNGRSMAGTASHVNVWVGADHREAIVIPTDTNGVASLKLTLVTAEINIPSPSNGRGSVLMANPVMKYNESLRINVPYALCQPHVGDYSWLKTMDLTTSRVLQEGITMANTCGKPRAVAKPGEVIIFVRPLNWWEKLKE